MKKIDQAQKTAWIWTLIAAISLDQAHDIIDPFHPDPQIDVVYPQLLLLITQSEESQEHNKKCKKVKI